ncbi:MAG: acetylxylan esterase [Planctomycetota bacterium]
MSMQSWLGLFIAVLCMDVTAISQEGNSKKQSALELSIQHPAGIFQIGESCQFTALVGNKSEEQIVGTLQWRVKTTAFPTSDYNPQRVTLAANSEQECYFNLKLEKTGFAEVICTWQPTGGKQIEKKYRVGASPHDLVIPTTKEKDFDSFWAAALNELNNVEMQAVQEARPERKKSEGIDVFEVSLQSVDGVCVRGWLEVPAKVEKDQKLPVVIRVPGYGANMRPVGRSEDMIVFSFNPRAHGKSTDQVAHDPVDYWIRGLDSPHTYYYRGAYLDCIRAIDFVSSHSNVDQDRIAVWGGSQGGGFAFAMAALDDRVDLCISDIPFLCDWVNYFKLTVWPEMDDWIEAKPERTWESTLKTLSYFDTMNLVDRIQCRVIMGVGLQDQVCPPTTCFAAFNQIPGSKKYMIYRDSGHGLGREHTEGIWKRIRRAFQLP